MTRAPEVEGAPRAHLAVPSHWPFGEIENDHPAARYAQQFSRNLALAVGRDSYRSLARRSGVTHSTIGAIIRGDTWPDLITISKLEWALGTELWPGPALFAEQLRGLRMVQAEYLRFLARRRAKLPLSGPYAPGEPGTVCVRVLSHRARHKLADLLGVEKLDDFVEIRDRLPWPHFVVIPDDRAADALDIAGVQPLSTVPSNHMRSIDP